MPVVPNNAVMTFTSCLYPSSYIANCTSFVRLLPRSFLIPRFICHGSWRSFVLIHSFLQASNCFISTPILFSSMHDTHTRLTKELHETAFRLISCSAGIFDVILCYYICSYQGSYHHLGRMPCRVYRDLVAMTRPSCSLNRRPIHRAQLFVYISNRLTPGATMFTTIFDAYTRFMISGRDEMSGQPIREDILAPPRSLLRVLVM